MNTADPAPNRPSVTVTQSENGSRVDIAGPVTVRSARHVRDALAQVDEATEIRIDLGGVTRLDTAGAWVVIAWRDAVEAAGGEVTMDGATPQMKAIIETVTRALPETEATPTPHMTLTDMVARVGQEVVSASRFLLSLAGYFGLFLARLLRSVAHPREFRLTSLVHHCQEVGVRAVPIVALMAFLIGIVLAFQGASQLRQFGAEVFVVDLIAISILRELGILLTAIIVAGRTASAFTAAIGSMKMREEIDAMRTLGLDPAMILFVPRILALLLMLPILGLIANLAGLFGGALMAWAELGISPAMFRTRLLEGTDVDHVIVGVVKAPVFALIIGVIGCHAGMQVGNNAESLGRQTSKAVVASIFAVIVADALFSVFFAQIGM